MGTPCARTPREQGLVLLALLAFILITCLAASTLVASWQTQARREKEEQLLFVGDQYRRAITAYYNTVPPGGSRSLPPTLDALLDDNRFASPRHHLRRLYADPMTGSPDWELVRVSSGIAAVHSRSTERPLKITGFSADDRSFENASGYAEWVFGMTTRSGNAVNAQ